ncbi:Prolyl 4-Hydroxylase Subunit Alpha-2 [Manis pentadactyla]|nr:Prolyl 4-Hydroxylase Subunit Alpha-2 [Manis pentadactyla]
MPQLLIAPFKKEDKWDSLHIVRIYNVMSDKEIERIKEIAKPNEVLRLCRLRGPLRPSDLWALKLMRMKRKAGSWRRAPSDDHGSTDPQPLSGTVCCAHSLRRQWSLQPFPGQAAHQLWGEC